VARERPLCIGCREHCVLCARERDEERVALIVDLGATMRGERFAKQTVMLGEDGRVLAAVGSEQLRRAFDVREQERRCR
jgi:hypothetical protein